MNSWTWYNKTGPGFVMVWVAGVVVGVLVAKGCSGSVVLIDFSEVPIVRWISSAVHPDMMKGLGEDICAGLLM